MTHEMFIWVALLLEGFFLLYKGAEWFVKGSVRVSKKMGISPMIIGLTLVAMGTSLPELSVSFLAAVKGNSDIAVGNVLGSNTVNILLVLGLSALVATAPLKVRKNTSNLEIPALLILSTSLFIMSADFRISRVEGIVLLLLFVLYAEYLVYQERKFHNALNIARFQRKKSVARQLRELRQDLAFEENQADRLQPAMATAGSVPLAQVTASVPLPEMTTAPGEDVYSSTRKKVESVAKAHKEEEKVVLFVVLGLAALILGSYLTVDAATGLAYSFGLSQRIVAVTVVALGTSLPELFTSVSAARSGNDDIAIGNIVGSNIFNLLFILGISATVQPVSFYMESKWDLAASIFATLLLLVLIKVPKKQRLQKWASIPLLLGLVAYIVFLLVNK